jgi:asparagine synthase (glutamine-hydrolysing)
VCSIVGAWWRFAPPPSGTMAAMMEGALALLQRRGPDERTWQSVSSRCVMGGNRLIIRGGPGQGSMPFVAGKRLAYYNGELYNYRGWAPQAVSDGEALLPAFDSHGPAAFRHLDGEFAVAIYDGETDSVVLARDSFGCKPLYFSFDGQRLLWASSANAIRHMAPHPFCAAVHGPNHRGSGVPQEPYTSFAGIWQVPPGHVLIASPGGVALHAYNQWPDATLDQDDPSEVFALLEQSLTQRLEHTGTVAIPLSGGIDSGIIAFMADRLGVPYHIFSVVEMMGQPTSEAPYILERLKRLKRPTGVTLLACNDAEVAAALHDIYRPEYYEGEHFDSSNLPMHTVMQAVQQAGLRVVVDGTGADEIFHGYENMYKYQPLPDWPQPWQRTHNYYGVFTTLLAFTAKSDRAGAFFSLETRYPYQSADLLRASLRLRLGSLPKWPLRRFLMERLDYGPPTPLDLHGKEGFSLQRVPKDVQEATMQRVWCQANGLDALPSAPPKPFPFIMGQPLPQATGTTAR